MNLYEQFLAKQNEIVDLINAKENKENELNAIKREIFKKHKERFAKKPTGKTTINDSGFEIVYNRTEKITLLTNEIERLKFSSPAIQEKVVPEKRELKFSKTEFKKLADDEQEKVEKFIARELNKPTMQIKPLDEK